MDEYKKPYLTLWNAVTDALEQLNRQNYSCAEETLLKAQQDAEEIYGKTAQKDLSRIAENVI